MLLFNCFLIIFRSGLSGLGLFGRLLGICRIILGSGFRLFGFNRLFLFLLLCRLAGSFLGRF